MRLRFRHLLLPILVTLSSIQALQGQTLTIAAAANLKTDTRAPVIAQAVNLVSGIPESDSGYVRIGAGFSEHNPTYNRFYVELNHAGYGAAASGDSKKVL